MLNSVGLDFEQILDECLARLHGGSSLDECLAQFPEHAELLRPLLSTTQRLQTIQKPLPARERMDAARARMLAVANQRKSQKSFTLPVSNGLFSRYTAQIRRVYETLRNKEKGMLALPVRAAVSLMVALLIGGMLTVGASANALPGDALYDVKLAWENVRMVLTLREQARVQLDQQIQQQREEEIRSLIDLKRSGEVEFIGPLQAQNDEELQVGEFQMRVVPETTVDAGLQSGETVRVRVRVLNNGELTALRVETAEDHGSQKQPTKTATPIPDDEVELPGDNPQGTPLPAEPSPNGPQGSPPGGEAPGPGPGPGPHNTAEPNQRGSGGSAAGGGSDGNAIVTPTPTPSNVSHSGANDQGHARGPGNGADKIH